MAILYVEPAIVPDVFASGLAEAEDLGDGNIRFTYFVKQKSFIEIGGVEHVIVARIVMPFPALILGRRLTGQRLGICCEMIHNRLAH